MSDRIRLYVIGDCDGFASLRDQLAGHSEIDFVGESEHVGQAAPVLAGGHLDCIIHASRSSNFPAADVAAIRAGATGSTEGVAVVDLAPTPEGTQETVHAG